MVPSNFEAFGIVLVESMAMGSVPVCSSAPAFSWILGRYSETLQVLNNDPAEYADIIEHLLNNPSIYLESRAGLRERQQSHFSASAIGTAYDRLLRELTENSRKVERSGRIDIPIGEKCKDYGWGKLLHRLYMKLKSS
jgi:glycosyltransferase involved in cell wall biosynthesis